MDNEKAKQLLLTGILHPTDFSRGSDVAFAHALKLGLQAATKLNIVHVERKLDVADWSGFPGVRRMLSRWGFLPQGAARADLRKTGLRVSKTLYLGTSPAETVIRELERQPADLVVLATHRKSGMERWLHQEIAHKISRSTDALTLFVPYGIEGFVRLDDGQSTLQRILFPVDTSPWPQVSVDTACALVSALSCGPVEFQLVYVGTDEAEMPALKLPDRPGWHWKQTVCHGNVVDQILAVADDWSADLIVMTTHGHHGFLDAIRGSTTERVLQGAQCPVLAVPAAWRQRDRIR